MDKQGDLPRLGVRVLMSFSAIFRINLVKSHEGKVHGDFTDFFRVLIYLCLCFSLSIVHSAVARTSLKLVEVEVSGQAETESLAIKNALVEAIGRVNGRQMAALERLDQTWEEGPKLGPDGRFYACHNKDQRIIAITGTPLKAMTRTSGTPS